MRKSLEFIIQIQRQSKRNIGEIWFLLVDNEASASSSRLNLASAKGAQIERTSWDPKDGELCEARSKPEETLVEDCSGSNVQIDRRSFV